MADRDDGQRPEGDVPMRADAATLISDDYQKQQQHLHETTEYGTMAQHYGPLVSQIVEKLELTHLLDYGCGRRMGLTKPLKVKHRLTYQGYDPGAGLDELATAPVPAQMVCCIDVLEHIEPLYLENVLDHLAELTEVVTFLSVHTGPAMKTLPDGRNAHLTQQPIEWWLPKIWQRFDIQTMQKVGDHSYYVIGYARPRLEAPDGTKLVA
jgi:hypothetical protein